MGLWIVQQCLNALKKINTKYIHKSLWCFLYSMLGPASTNVFCMLSNKEHADVAVVNYTIHCLHVYSSMYLSFFFPACACQT